MLSSALESNPGCLFYLITSPHPHLTYPISVSLSGDLDDKLSHKYLKSNSFSTPPTCLPQSPREHEGICLLLVLAKGLIDLQILSCSINLNHLCALLCIMFVSLEYYISLKCFQFSVSDFIVPFSLKTKHKSLSSSSPTLHISQHGHSNPCKRESMCLTEPGLAPRIPSALRALQDAGMWGPCGAREKSWHIEEVT